MASNEYWAGFFDGEGSIGLYEKAKYPGVFDFGCSVTQKVARPLLALAGQFGGSVNTHSRGISAWKITGNQSEDFIKAVLPHLDVKARQARLYLFGRRLAVKFRYNKTPLINQALRVLARELKKEKHVP
jgi:hypothetical protein